MAHLHFAWELGGGLGHAGRIRPLAQEALRRGHHVTISLRDLVHTDKLLHDVAALRFQAPVWLHQVHGVPSPAICLAEIMLTCGYLNKDALQGLFSGWCGLLSHLKPDLLVADYAPTALLAARSLGIRSASLGIGFFIPPDVAPMPSIRDWEPAQPGRLEAADRQMLTAINAVLERVGAQPLERAAQAFHGDASMLLTWPELDHYNRSVLPDGQRWWGPSMFADASERPAWPAGSGPKVFAYIKSDHPDHLALLRALVDLGCRTICYLPEVAAGKPPPVQSPLITYARGPVELGSTLAQADLCVCHAGEATLAQALLAGVPLLLLPMQAEQFLNSRRVEQTGAGINAAQRKRPLDYAALLTGLLYEPGAKLAAQNIAARHKDFTPRKHTESLVTEFERLLGKRDAL